jgi:4-hydroxy-tetrahydrodipicolinate synthase
MFSGSLVAIVTPMQDDGSIDYTAWSRLIDWHIESGTTGLVVGGSTGESATVTDSELWDLTQRACEQVRQRIAVIVGVGSSSTATSVARAGRFSQLPVAGVLAVTPAYNRPTQEGLFRHFAAVAEASSKPLILYNVPSRTAVDMMPPTIARLSQLERVRAVKEAVPEIERVRELVATCRPGFVVLSGDDATAREAIFAGAQGVISVTANVAPGGMAAMAAAAIRGDRESAAQLDAPLAALHRDLFLEGNPIPVKWALAQAGRIGRGIRLPLTELSAEHRPAVLAALRQAAALQ